MACGNISFAPIITARLVVGSGRRGANRANPTSAFPLMFMRLIANRAESYRIVPEAQKRVSINVYAGLSHFPRAIVPLPLREGNDRGG